MTQRADDPEHKYRKERERIASSDLPEPDIEAILEFLSAFDSNDSTAAYTNEYGEHETLSYSSLEGYGRGLRLIATNSDKSLLDHTLGSLQAVFDQFLERLAKRTVRQRQAAAIKFYRYHELEVDPDSIILAKVDDDGAVDPRDMFEKDEIQSMRDACDNTRDRALLELLVYTGQRVRAIQTLRIKDIDLDNGVYYLNTEDSGLKGADKNGKKRPLLGAEKAVRQWINQHPTGNPEDYLISPLPSATGTNDPGQYLCAPAIRHRLWKIAEKADVYDRETGEGKSPNPHNFRHYFVTVCYREYNMDPSTIKFLIGHDQDSKVMETTYQHLTDDDYINQARRQINAGREADKKQSSLTPETCPTCQEPLPPNAKACPDCGMVFTPDAQAAQESMDEYMKESYKETQPGDADTMEKLDQLDEILDDPEVKAALVERLNEE